MYTIPVEFRQAAIGAMRFFIARVGEMSDPAAHVLGIRDRIVKLLREYQRFPKLPLDALDKELLHMICCLYLSNLEEYAADVGLDFHDRSYYRDCADTVALLRDSIGSHLPGDVVSKNLALKW